MCDPFCIATIICIYLYTFCLSLYTSCRHNFYDVHFLLIRIDVYKMYTKCNPHCTYKFSCKTSFKILYTQCTQKFVEMCDTFCIHLVYIFLTSVVCILHNFCIQNVGIYTISVWDSTLQLSVVVLSSKRNSYT